MNESTIDRYFNPKRFLFLLRYELYMNYRALIVILATTLGIAFTVNVFSAAAASHFRIHEVFYPILPLMAGGFFFSSRVFRDIHKSGQDLRYLTLPCSRLEKTIAKFVFTAVIYIVVSLVGYFLMSVLASLVTLFFSGKSHGLFNPFAGSTLKLIGIYLVLQSVFVFGSLFFKRLPIAKTLLSAIALVFVVACFSGLVFLATHIDLVFRGMWTWWTDGGRAFDPGTMFGIWKEVPTIIFCALVAPFFWVLTYIRLKEQEVRSV
jgi:hypothetical protein